MVNLSDLQELVKSKFKDIKFIMVSNREPYIHKYVGDEIKVIRPASGLVSAIDPVMKASHGTWVAHGSGEADPEVVDKNDRIAVPPKDPKYKLRRIWLTKEEEDGYYYGFANKTLWPMCHIVHRRPNFDDADWRQYRKVNQKFAKAALEEIGSSKAMVWIQDYHLALAARYIKEARPDIFTALFWHIPWPNPEAFRICPWRVELLKGLMTNDLLGFHIKYHCDNFLDAVDLNLEARTDREHSKVTYRGHTTVVKPFPISTDFEGIAARARSPEVEAEMKNIKKLVHAPYEYLAVGLDRIDYTKGIIERLRAIDRFLEKYPKYRKKFVYVGIGSPSRTHIREYKELMEDISSLVEEINWKHRYGNWYPIIYKEEHIGYDTILALYRDADLCLVSSLHDGMNLVAKEFVASQVDGHGMLVLSRFTGSARELTDAVFVNPYDTEKFADSIKAALELSESERGKRMNRLSEVVKENNIYTWAANFITELLRIEGKA